MAVAAAVVAAAATVAFLLFTTVLIAVSYWICAAVFGDGNTVGASVSALFQRAATLAESIYLSIVAFH